MKEDTKIAISIVAVLLLVVCFGAGTTYICKHPEKRRISYYEDSDYYICDVRVDVRDHQNHFGVIKKSDYEKWKRGDSGTIWLVNARYKDRGWRLNCRNIISIAIYDKGGCIPLFF